MKVVKKLKTASVNRATQESSLVGQTRLAIDVNHQSIRGPSLQKTHQDNQVSAPTIGDM
jgi:hypothetical protein